VEKIDTWSLFGLLNTAVVVGLGIWGIAAEFTLPIGLGFAYRPRPVLQTWSRMDDGRSGFVSFFVRDWTGRGCSGDEGTWSRLRVK
jgi:hypothetical protein